MCVLILLIENFPVYLPGILLFSHLANVIFFLLFAFSHQIYLDMQQYKVPFVKLHAVFPNSYPFDPPFIRVVAPYIERGRWRA